MTNEQGSEVGGAAKKSANVGSQKGEASSETVEKKVNMGADINISVEGEKFEENDICVKWVQGERLESSRKSSRHQMGVCSTLETVKKVWNGC